MSSDRGRGAREERRKAETDQGPQHVDALLIGEDQKRQERERQQGKANGEAKADDVEVREGGVKGSSNRGIA